MPVKVVFCPFVVYFFEMADNVTVNKVVVYKYDIFITKICAVNSCTIIIVIQKKWRFCHGADYKKK